MSLPWRWFLVLTLVAVAPAPVVGQDTGPSAATEVHPFQSALDHLEKQVEDGRYRGVVAVVEVDGDRALEAALGERDAASGSAMEPDTIFRIYSMTKPVTAVAALILCDAGELDLDAPVAKYLPQFEGLEVGVEGKDADGNPSLERVPAERPMTVRDLCRHTAGLTYGIFARSAVDALVREAGVFDPGITNEELVRRLSEVPLKSQPGARFEYSLASDVLGRVVEVVAEKPLDEFMRERIFAPLGMLDTGFTVPEAKLGRVATCYRRAGGELVPTRRGQALDPSRPSKLQSGGGGLYSTAEDYVRFCRMLLGGGALGEVRIIREESAREMMSDQLDGAPAPMLALTGGGFGLGLAVTKTARRKGPHGGTVWWGGYAGTGFWIDREAKTIGVFMIQNMNELQHSSAFRSQVYAGLGR